MPKNSQGAKPPVKPAQKPTAPAKPVTTKPTIAAPEKPAKREPQKPAPAAAPAPEKKPQPAQPTPPAKPEARKAAPLAGAIVITPMAHYSGLNLQEACGCFRQCADRNRTSFLETGKLHVAISDALEKLKADPKTKKANAARSIYGELRQLGVRDGAISNASYAARVWNEYVKPGHLTEADYDDLGFQEAFGIIRAASQKSKLILTPKEVVALVRNPALNLAAELVSLYENGCTVAQAEEKAAREKKIEEDRQKTEDAAKKKKDADAEKARTAAAVKAALAANPPAQTVTVTAGPAADLTTGQATGFTPADTERGITAGGGESEEHEEHEEPEVPEAPLPPERPSNIHTMPPNPDAGLVAILEILDSVVTETAEFTPAAQSEVAAKLREALAVIDGRLPQSKAA